MSEPNTVFVVDSESHASIIDGCRLGDARVCRFQHNDMDDLRRVLRLVEGKRKIVVVEESTA